MIASVFHRLKITQLGEFILLALDGVRLSWAWPLTRLSDLLVRTYSFFTHPRSFESFSTVLNKFYIPWKHWLSTKWVMIVFKTKIYLKSHISYSLGAGVEWHGLEDGSQQTEPVSPAPCPPRPPCLPVLVQPQTREKLGIWLADHLLTSLRRTDRRVPPLPTTVASRRNMIPLMKMCHNLVIVTKDSKVKIFNRIRHENIHH